MTISQLDLFSSAAIDEISLPRPVHELSGLIEGLDYLPDFVTPDEENKILRLIDNAEWSCELSRRVQHYGYKYDYKARRINEDMWVGELPNWLKYLGKRLTHFGVFNNAPDQVIINEYLPGQGITPHVDCEPCFGDTIASLSLGSTCVMDLTQVKTGEVKEVLLERGSVLVLKGESRYLWRHGIAKRQKDIYKGVAHLRQRRVSLTFRTVKWE